tara:strand:+ start:656 stop:1696 length:1041 start_codon:yes stop_codon:yes gene_type:complete
MKYFKYLFILIVFFKTETLLSADRIFSVNNIELAKKGDITQDELVNKAIKKGFKDLVERILLNEDKNKVLGLEFSKIKDLVLYYQITDSKEDFSLKKINFNIIFDKAKFHDLFYKLSVPYSEIINEEIYLLPIIVDEDKLFVYSKNLFYDKWNDLFQSDIMEFILPVENIETLQIINSNKENLIGLDLNSLFQEYSNKNLALIIIDISNEKGYKIYLRTKILEKKIDKNIKLNRLNLNEADYIKKVINKTSEEIINLVKSQNLIDVRTPSFLNVQLQLSKSNNLIELNNRLKKIGSIDNIFVQELNSEYVLLKIKYLGKLNKIMDQLKNQNIQLKLIKDQWRLKII